MSEDIKIAPAHIVGHREYLRAAQRMADRSMAARCWRGNSRLAVVVVLFVAALAVAFGVLAAIY
jgi:hypothetical protein